VKKASDPWKNCFLKGSFPKQVEEENLGKLACQASSGKWLRKEEINLVNCLAII